MYLHSFIHTKCEFLLSSCMPTIYLAPTKSVYNYYNTSRNKTLQPTHAFFTIAISASVSFLVHTKRIKKLTALSLLINLKNLHVLAFTSVSI